MFEIKKTFVLTKVKNKNILESTLFFKVKNKVKIRGNPQHASLVNLLPTARPAASSTSPFHHHRSPSLTSLHPPTTIWVNNPTFPQLKYCSKKKLLVVEKGTLVTKWILKQCCIIQNTVRPYWNLVLGVWAILKQNFRNYSESLRSRMYFQVLGWGRKGIVNCHVSESVTLCGFIISVYFLDKG